MLSEKIVFMAAATSKGEAMQAGVYKYPFVIKVRHRATLLYCRYIPALQGCSTAGMRQCKVSAMLANTPLCSFLWVCFHLTAAAQGQYATVCRVFGCVPT